MRVLLTLLVLAIVAHGCAEVVSSSPVPASPPPLEDVVSPAHAGLDEGAGGVGLPEGPAGPLLEPGPVLPSAPAGATALPLPDPAVIPAPPPGVELWPDLVPYADKNKGWESPIVLGAAREVGAPGGGDGLFIAFGVKNAGHYEAFDIVSRLFINSQEAWVLPLARLLPQETAFGYAPMDDIAGRLLLYPGRYRVELVVDSDNFVDELDNANNSYSADMVLARSPVDRRSPESAAEIEIHRFLDTNARVTGQNINEVMAMAREVLKDVPVDYSRIKITVLPFDAFNTRYGDALGKNLPEKARLAEAAASYPQVGLGFVRGTAAVQEVVIREGLLKQMLTVLFRELGGAYYQQMNERGKAIGSVTEANELAVTLFEAYAMRLLQEKYGWSGAANVSYLVDRRPVVAALWDGGPLGRYVRRTWALALSFGYDGKRYVPSSQLYGWYLNLINMRNPTFFIRSLDRNATAMDRNVIARNVSWRGLVDKEPSPLPEAVRKAVDPRDRIGPALTDDYLLVFQTHFLYP